MPKSVATFEKLAYLALVLRVLTAIINYPITMQLERATPDSVIVIQILSAIFQITFIWLIARKRKGWARLIWIAAMIPGVATAAMLNLIDHRPYNGLGGTVALFSVYLVSMISAIYLLRSDARAWFRAVRPEI